MFYCFVLPCSIINNNDKMTIIIRRSENIYKLRVRKSSSTHGEISRHCGTKTCHVQTLQDVHWHRGTTTGLTGHGPSNSAECGTNCIWSPLTSMTGCHLDWARCLTSKSVFSVLSRLEKWYCSPLLLLRHAASARQTHRSKPAARCSSSW